MATTVVEIAAAHLVARTPAQATCTITRITMTSITTRTSLTTPRIHRRHATTVGAIVANLATALMVGRMEVGDNRPFLLANIHCLRKVGRLSILSNFSFSHFS